MFNAALAERFAVAAVKAGGGRATQQLRAEALMNSGRGAAAAAMYRALIDTVKSTALRVTYTLAVTATIVTGLKHLEVAEETLLSVRDSAAETGLTRAYDDVAAFVYATTGRPREAVTAAVHGRVASRGKRVPSSAAVAS